MDWVRDNFQLIIIAAGAIAFWINQARREKNGEQADYDDDGVPDNREPPQAGTREMRPLSRDGSDPAQDERVRQIQEEIRRKIAERRGQSAPPPMPAPQLEPFNPLRPVFSEQPDEAPARPPRLPSQPPGMPTVREVVAHDDQAALERQRRMAEQLEELENRRLEARRAAQTASEAAPGSHAEVWGKAAGIGAPAAVAGGKGPAPGGRALAAELRDPRALRRAMVLREVLDPPVALR